MNNVRFSLDRAHPEHRDKIEGLIRGLLSHYPWVPLREVRLYQPKGNDRSLGDASKKGVISLNSYWFACDPKILEEAAENRVRSPDGVAFHGLMAIEPDHVVTHEFGHILTDARPDWKAWTEPRWRAATRDTSSAPSGYAVANPGEYFAEAFAEYALGLAPDDRDSAMKTFLQ
jgi:hypothetical protein